MANSYYSISTASRVADFKAALTGFYGAGVTVHYDNSEYIVFTCSAISNKVIKIKLDAYSPQLFYGDTWSSGTTITNEVKMYGQNYYGSSNVLHLILSDNFLWYTSIDTGGNYSISLIYAKMSNDDYIVCCAAKSEAANCIGKNLSTDDVIRPFTFTRAISSSTGKLYQQPFMFTKNGGEFIENTDGSPAYIDGLLNIGHKLGNKEVIVTAEHYMGLCDLIMSDAVTYFQTCIYAAL